MDFKLAGRDGRRSYLAFQIQSAVGEKTVVHFQLIFQIKQKTDKLLLPISSYAKADRENGQVITGSPTQ